MTAALANGGGAMTFELRYALSGLVEPTPAYLVSELFAHGQTESRRVAITTLTQMGRHRHCRKILTEMLSPTGS